MMGDSLQELIEGVEYQYSVVSSREFPGKPLQRVSYMLEESYVSYPVAESTHKYYRGFLYVHDLLTVDLVMKDDNYIMARYIPQIEEAVKAVLSHSQKIDLEPDEWPLMIEIAQRVKDNLPNIKIVPDGQD